MFLNTIVPAPGSRKPSKRVGRGIGSGLGKTCGRGHKGQRSRAGGFHKVGFEGGQMPLQRRLPKRGFNSLTAKYSAQITLSEIQSLPVTDIDVLTLKQAGLVAVHVNSIKVIVSGSLNKAVSLKGIKATAGARRIIEDLGGSIFE